MKVALLLSAIFLLNSVLILPQWKLQTNSTTKTLRSVDAVNKNVVWVCGYNGTVLRTKDAGKTWIGTSITDGNYENISIEALDANTAWVTGSKLGGLGAKIWKTTNGGNSWIEQWYDSLVSCNGMKFLDSKNAVACFDYGDPVSRLVIVATSDGGTHWNRISRSSIPPLDVYNGESGLENSMTVSGDNVWFETYSKIESKIYHSTNKGLNWSRTLPLIPTATARCLYAVPISASKLIALGGDGWPGFSEDGGKTWYFPKLQSIGLFATSLTMIPDTNVIIAVGLQGRSMLSTNYGESWINVPHTQEVNTLRSISAFSPRDIWCVGNNGLIYKWTGTATSADLADEYPSEYQLYQNYPNPFNPSTRIEYRLPLESKVEILIFNTIGQKISDLVNQAQGPGRYEVEWSAGNRPSGTYFYEIRAVPVNGNKEFRSIKKMMVIK